jgi:glycosyltransferase involved in cell wall biosynthesis
MSGLTVHHFGPDVNSVGGMASAIRVLAEQHVGADAVECHASWTPRSRMGTCALSLRSTGEILRLPRGELVHVHLSERGSFIREGFLLALAHRRGLTTVATIHGASFASFARHHRRIVALVLGSADAVICLDETALELARRAAPDVVCEIVPNPIVPDPDPAPADTTAELVLFAGEISLRKGADVLHAAWQLISAGRPDARCMMVGPEGDFSPPAAPRLEVRGVASPPEMRAMLRACRVVALPSRAEAMPMILVEAMGSARPFVSTPVGAVPELAAGGGMLVPVGDAEALAESLLRMLDDPGEARSLGERGLAMCRETRSVAIVDTRLRDIYRRAREHAASQS